jgi:hypothetical protein
MELKHNYKIELAKTLSQHYYSVHEGKKFLGYFPSATTILLAFPTSPQLTAWIAQHGMEEATNIRDEAGISGTKIHSACDMLEEGQTLFEANYTIKEWVKIKSFVDWYHEYKPTMVAGEIPVFSKKGKYAGRVDRIYKINGDTIVLDFKSSSALHPQFPLQFSAYANAIEENSDEIIDMTAVLLLGASNKNGYRYETYPEWKEHYKVFKNVRETWQYNTYGSKKTKKEPPVLILPESLKL